MIKRDTNIRDSLNPMPALFVGHGSPMNLIESNQFTKTISQLGKQFNPKAILVISAHWLETKSVVQNANPQKQIYDFYGFSEELYKITYQARGWTEDLIKKISELDQDIQFVQQRGIDHGTWAVLHHMYPEANIPIVQLSIRAGIEFSEYFEIGQKLRELRKYGVMILGSGNIVHNLSLIDWNMNALIPNWATDFDDKVKNLINDRDFDKLVSISSDDNKLFNLAHPTAEHFIPLLYTLGATYPTDELSYPCAFFQNGSISMRSVLFQ